MIGKCTCSHEFQDATYGKGNRVFNPCKPASKDAHYHRCTVCSSVKSFSGSDVEVKKKDKK
jgi:hypothetical protein